MEPSDQHPQDQDLNTEDVSTEDQDSTNEQPEASDVLDLSSVEKFRYKDLELTPDELDKHMLRQADYTRKTQELAETRKALEEDQKYYGALQADLMAVRENPNLESEFKKIYPEKFHKFLDAFTTRDQQETGENNQALPKDVQEKLSKFEQFMSEQQKQIEEQRVNEHIQQIEKWEADYTKKYDLADPTVVWTKVQSALDAGKIQEKDVTSKYVEGVFKSVHEQSKKLFENYSKTQFEKSRENNQKASDIGKGGGVAGQAPKKLRLDEVADQMIADLSAR